jgi:hypothetical protein
MSSNNYCSFKCLHMITIFHLLHFPRCENTACVCSEGWTGSRCQDRGCDLRCSLHGQCKNGTCLCVTGWNGIHCTLEGCPKACASHGTCKANLVIICSFICSPKGPLYFPPELIGIGKERSVNLDTCFDNLCPTGVTCQLILHYFSPSLVKMTIIFARFYHLPLRNIFHTPWLK